MRVEEWKDIVFTDRYVASKITCSEAEDIISQTRDLFAPLSLFAYDTHEIYGSLENSMNRYKKLLLDTYKAELSVLSEFTELMNEVKAALSAIGNDRTGFLSHINCGTLSYFSCNNRLCKGSISANSFGSVYRSS